MRVLFFYVDGSGNYVPDPGVKRLDRCWKPLRFFFVYVYGYFRGSLRGSVFLGAISALPQWVIAVFLDQYVRSETCGVTPGSVVIQLSSAGVFGRLKKRPAFDQMREALC